MRITTAGILNAAAPRTNRAFSTFPSAISLPDGRILATYRVGSAKDCDDETVELRESQDLGVTWSEARNPFPPFTESGLRYSLKLVYLTLLPGEKLLAAAMGVDRTSYPGKPLFNETTQGCLPMRILVSESADNGITWNAWRAVDIPQDIGPPSLTNPVLRFPDGRLAMSLESNKQYLDSSPWFQKVTYLYSTDSGRIWGNPVVVSRDATGQVFNWDQRAGVTPDGAIVTFTWVFDSGDGVYRNIWRRYSLDGGTTWTDPEDLGFADQPSHPAIFQDGRIVLSWVDRFGAQTIRARMARGFREPFSASSEVVLYQPAASVGTSQGSLSDTLDEMSRWAYGLPFVRALPNGEAMVVYYAGSLAGTGVHWARLSLA
jgi:hypothetical protein